MEPISAIEEVRSRFRWDERALQYRSRRTGRFVPRQQVRRVLDETLDAITSEMTGLSRQLQDGTLSLARWQQQMQGYVRDLHLLSVAAERGGWGQMRLEDFGRVGRILRDEYERLRTFARQIADGTQALDGTLLNRTRLYGQAGRVSYHLSERARMAARGFDEARRVLSPADHCRASDGPRPGCVEEAAKGWVSIGEVVPIGAANCLTNCRCYVEYRNTATGEVVGRE